MEHLQERPGLEVTAERPSSPASERNMLLLPLAFTSNLAALTSFVQSVRTRTYCQSSLKCSPMQRICASTVGRCCFAFSWLVAYGADLNMPDKFL